MGKSKGRTLVCDWCTTRFRKPGDLSLHEKNNHSWELREEAAERARQAGSVPRLGLSIVQAATREIIKIKVKACAELQEEVIFQLQQELEHQLEKEASAFKKAAPLSTLVHGKMEFPTYHCPICFMVFATEHGLRNHTASKLSHLIKLCPLCQTFRGFAENDILTHITSGRCQASQGLSKQQVHWMLEAREPHTALCVKVHMWAHGLSDGNPGSAVASQSQTAPAPATEPRSSSNNGAHNLKYQCPFCEEAFIIPAFLIAHLTGPTHPEQTFHCTKSNCPGVFTDALSFFAHTASCAGRSKAPMAPATPIQTPTRALQAHAPVFTTQMTNQENQPMNLSQTSGGSSYRKPGPRRAVPNPADRSSEQLPKNKTATPPVLYYRFPPVVKVEPISNAPSMTSVIVPDAQVTSPTIKSVPPPKSDTTNESHIHHDANEDNLIDLEAQKESSIEKEPASKPISSKPTAQSVPPHLRHKVDAIHPDQTQRTEALPTKPSAVQPGDGQMQTQDANPAHEDPFHRMWLMELDKKNREDRERQAKVAEEALLKARATESALVNSNIDKIKALAIRKKPADPVVITKQETALQKQRMQEPAVVETLEAGSTWW